MGKNAVKRAAVLVVVGALLVLGVGQLFADAMTVTNTGVQRNGFDIYDIDVTTEGVVTSFSFTLPELRDELQHQGLKLRWILSEVSLREFELNTVAVAALQPDLEGTTHAIEHLRYAISLAD